MTPPPVKKQTAPLGHPVSHSASEESPEWPLDEVTGVGDPMEQMNRRSRNATRGMKAAFGAISELRRTVTGAVQQDKADHDRIYDSMDDIKSKVDRLETKVDTIEEHMGNLREQSARTGAHVERLVALTEVKEQAEIKADIHISTVEKEMSIKDTAAVKKLKRQIAAKFVIPIVTALATAISAYILTR